MREEGIEGGKNEWRGRKSREERGKEEGKGEKEEKAGMERKEESNTSRGMRLKVVCKVNK